MPEDYIARRTAILFNNENSWNIDQQKQNNTWNTLGHVEKYYRSLKSFGAPVDFINEKKEVNKIGDLFTISEIMSSGTGSNQSFIDLFDDKKTDFSKLMKLEIEMMVEAG